MASVVGSSSASRSRVGRSSGVMDVEWKISSASRAGSTRSLSTIAGTSPTWVNRSPAKRVAVVSSNHRPLSQLWGTCGVARNRSRWLPRSRTSSSVIIRGGRSARSFSETMTTVGPCTTIDDGAAARNWFIAPHSSASTWQNEIQARSSRSITCETAADTDGYSMRMPVWKRKGCSSRTRNWLNWNPPGAASGTRVESRNTSGAISSIVVSIGVPFGSSATRVTAPLHCLPLRAIRHRGKPLSDPRIRHPASSRTARAAASARLRTPSLVRIRPT